MYVPFSWLARTDPRDVARVESKTFISTPRLRDAKPVPKDGVKGQLSNWLSPEDTDRAVEERFPHCMKGTVREDCKLIKFKKHDNLYTMK